MEKLKLQVAITLKGTVRSVVQKIVRLPYSSNNFSRLSCYIEGLPDISDVQILKGFSWRKLVGR